MHKAWLICWKDVQILLRDRIAWLMLLAAPFLLALGMGAVTGAFSDSSTPVEKIPIALVNLDEGELGDLVLQAFASPELSALLLPQTFTTTQSARLQVEQDTAAAALIIPADFSAIFFAAQSSVPARIEIYANPTRPISVQVIQAVTAEILSIFNAQQNAAEVNLRQLLISGRLDPNQVAAYAQEFAQQAQIQRELPERAFTLRSVRGIADEPQEFNLMAYIAPGMALLFLMYTATLGGRSMLIERTWGTLPRLLISPTPVWSVLIGKLLANFVIGFAQVGVLVLASSVVFNLQWGDPLAVVLLIASAAAAATAWGMVLASFARDTFQVSSLGSAMMLLFGILGGSFFSLEDAAPWLQNVASITPNAWALRGFTQLALGRDLMAISPILLALLSMTAILFIVSIFFARKRWASGFMN